MWLKDLDCVPMQFQGGLISKPVEFGGTVDFSDAICFSDKRLPRRPCLLRTAEFDTSLNLTLSVTLRDPFIPAIRRLTPSQRLAPSNESIQNSKSSDKTSGGKTLVAGILG